jgi:hypothetical protein
MHSQIEIPTLRAQNQRLKNQSTHQQFFFCRVFHSLRQGETPWQSIVNVSNVICVISHRRDVIEHLQLPRRLLPAHNSGASFHAAVFTKKNVAAKALSDQIVDFCAPGCGSDWQSALKQSQGAGLSSDEQADCALSGAAHSHSGERYSP